MTHFQAWRLVRHYAKHSSNRPLSGQHSEHRPIAILPCKKLSDGSPDRDFIARLQRALALASNQQISQLILSGGDTDGSGSSEAAQGRDWLQQQVWPPQIPIHLEQQAQDTFQNFKLSKALIKKNSPGDENTGILVISNRYHLARCIALARQCGLNAQAIAAEPTFFLPLNQHLRETGFLKLQAPEFSA